MQSALRSRRGVTLAEIMVALAMIAIMITMVVSFVFLITNRTKENAANDALRQDRQMLERGVEGWLAAVTEKGAELSFTDDAVTATIEGETYTLKFTNATLRGDLPEGQAITIRTQSVKAISFEMMTSENDPTDHLLFCTVISEDQNSGEDTSYTFCVNSRVGEIGGAQDEADD